MADVTRFNKYEVRGEIYRLKYVEIIMTIRGEIYRLKYVEKGMELGVWSEYKVCFGTS